MRLRNLLFLYTRRMRTHPLQELLALVGIAVGVALVFAVQVANTSVAGSVEELVRGVTGSATLQVTARGSDGVDAAIVPAIARLPGVRTAAPAIEVRANVRGPRGVRGVTLLGGDRRLVALRGALLAQFASPNLQLHDAIALPRRTADEIGARVGDQVALEIGARTHAAPVATVLTPDQIGTLANNPLVLAPLGYAQRIAGLRGRISRVLVEPLPGAQARVRAELVALAGAYANVGPSDMEARLLRQATAPNNESTALFAAISALVGLLFAFNAMLLTVPERRRFIADLRTEGLGDSTVVRLVLFDALLLGLAASLTGLLLGDQLSRHVFHAAPGYLSFAFTIGGQRIVDRQTIAIALAGGIGATLVAALRPLSDLAARRPLDAVYRTDERDEDRFAAPRRLVAAGVALVVGASAVLLLAPAATVVGIALLVGAMLLLTPRIVAGVLSLLDLLARRAHSAVLLVSLGELRASTTRSLALAATGALAVFGSVAVEGAHLDLQRGLDRAAHQFNAQSGLWVLPAGTENELATVSFDGGQVSRALAATAGVASLRSYRGGFLDIGDRRAWVVAPPAPTIASILPHQLTAGDLATATRRLRAGGWVALSAAIAEEQHLHVGDRVTLPTARPIPLRLAAIVTNFGWTAGAVILTAEDYGRAWGAQDVSALHVAVAPRVTPAALVPALRRALGPGSGLRVETAEQREQRFRASTRQGLSRLTQIATLVLVAAALALAAAMSGVIWSRRPRLATLKLNGFTDADVWRAIVLESGIVLGIGCTIGAVFGLYGQFMLTQWLTRSTGFPTSYAPSGSLALAALAGVTLVAVTIAALPGYLAARVPPTMSFQDD
ncbi:MAG: hypothetical protein JWQ48_1977 [Conexibacter sp.]|nr:hypothetical protein [Conexibacter sp.]